MPRMIRAFLIACAAAAVLAPIASASGTAASGAPMDPQGLIADDIESEAYAAYRRLSAQKAFKGPEIVLVDYRLPSSARRLFIVNLMTGAVEAHYVAHGRGSDPGHTNKAQRFSDALSTGMSSVGAYRGLGLYQSPDHGPALRLAGLDPTNASAYRRLIVFHTAAYFDPAAGKLGRSCGCFVVTAGEMTRVYDVIADGGFLYAGPVRLNDLSASTARDCNTACGNACPTTPPLMASNEPKAPVALASAEPPLAAPTPAPQPPVLLAAAPLPVQEAVLPPSSVPTPQVKPALPQAPAPVQVVEETPVPLPKPALDMAAEPPAQIAEASAAEIPTPHAKPTLDPAPSDAMALVTGLPLPAAKPGDLTAPNALAAALVPDIVFGETPVPAPKPVNLQRVADAGIVP